MIENPNKEQIREYLAKIGWKLHDHGCEHYYFYNHRGKCTGMSLVYPDTDGRIEFENKNSQHPRFYFYLRGTVMELLKSSDAVSFRGKTDRDIFILCSNYDRKRLPTPTPDTQGEGK